MVTSDDFEKFSDRAELLVIRGHDLQQLLLNVRQYRNNPSILAPYETVAHVMNQGYEFWLATLYSDPENMTVENPAIGQSLDAVERACPDLVRDDWDLPLAMGNCRRNLDALSDPPTIRIVWGAKPGLARPILSAHHVALEYSFRLLQFSSIVRDANDEDIRQCIENLPLGELIRKTLRMERTKTIQWLEARQKPADSGAEPKKKSRAKKPVRNSHVGALITELNRRRPEVQKGDVSELEIAEIYCETHSQCGKTAGNLLRMARERRDLLPPLPSKKSR